MEDLISPYEHVDVGWPEAKATPYDDGYIKYVGEVKTPWTTSEVSAILSIDRARPLYVKQEKRGDVLIVSLIDGDEVICGQTVFDLNAYG